MKLKEFFKHGVFNYALDMENWCKKFYPLELKYTFCHDFAIADWVSGVSGVKETYQRVKKSWLSDYKAFTEVVVSLNLLAWAHNQLMEQGIEDREQFVQLYSDLYHQATNDFYEKHGKNQEACDHFFNMTD